MREVRSATSRSRSSKSEEEKNGSSSKKEPARRAEAATNRDEERGLKRRGSAFAFAFKRSISRIQ